MTIDIIGLSQSKIYKKQYFFASIQGRVNYLASPFQYFHYIRNSLFARITEKNHLIEKFYCNEKN